MTVVSENTFEIRNEDFNYKGNSHLSLWIIITPLLSLQGKMRRATKKKSNESKYLPNSRIYFFV